MDWRKEWRELRSWWPAFFWAAVVALAVLVGNID